ncbi:MAG: ATP-dependent Clp protease proteolytic subunit [Patescibacteria group bacterium]
MKSYNDLKALWGENIIDLGGEVDAEMIEFVREAIPHFLAAGCPDITVIITSGGGDCQFGLAIYDLLRNYPSRIVCQNYAFADSIAAIILQAGDWRLAAQHAKIMIHNPRHRSIDNWAEYESEKIRLKNQKSLSRTRERIIAILLERTGRTRRQIERTLRAAKEMTAEEALRFGLIDGIIVPDKAAKNKTG